MTKGVVVKQLAFDQVVEHRVNFLQMTGDRCFK
jgi:hypothetical protein